jgi:hypothetical protein
VNLFDVLEGLIGTECCLVVADVKEKFNLKIVADRGVEKQHLVIISSRFAVLKT